MKSALFVVGGWEGHEPMLSAGIFATCLESEGYRTEMVDNLDIYCDAQRLHRFDLIVPVWTMGTITSEQEKGLLDAVKSESDGDILCCCRTLRGRIMALTWMGSSARRRPRPARQAPRARPQRP